MVTLEKPVPWARPQSPASSLLGPPVRPQRTFFLSASNLQASPGPLLFMILQFVALEISAGLSQTEPTFSQRHQARRADGFPHLFCCISHYPYPQLDDRNL